VDGGEGGGDGLVVDELFGDAFGLEESDRAKGIVVEGALEVVH